MPLPTFYATGSVSVINGATTVTGSGTGWGGDVIMAGDLFMDPAQPEIPPQRIASVTDGTHLELAVGWPGTDMTAAAYEIRFVGIIERSTAQSRRYIEMLGQLAALGIQPNAFGEFTDRAAYDGEAAGYKFLSLDGDGVTDVWTLYIKLSGASGDWDDGQEQQGPEGRQGPPGTGMIIAASDEVTEITAGVAKITVRAPYAIDLTKLKASLNVASSSGPVQVDINVNGASILSTKLTIDQGEKTSVTAAAPVVLSSANIADDDEITIDIDSAGTGAKGLKVTFVGGAA